MSTAQPAQRPITATPEQTQVIDTQHSQNMHSISARWDDKWMDPAFRLQILDSEGNLSDRARYEELMEAEAKEVQAEQGQYEDILGRAVDKKLMGKDMKTWAMDRRKKWLQDKRFMSRSSEAPAAPASRQNQNATWEDLLQKRMKQGEASRRPWQPSHPFYQPPPPFNMRVR